MQDSKYTGRFAYFYCSASVDVTTATKQFPGPKTIPLLEIIYCYGVLLITFCLVTMHDILLKQNRISPPPSSVQALFFSLRGVLDVVFR